MIASRRSVGPFRAGDPVEKRGCPLSEMKTITITSGKGGAGKTHLAVAVCLEWARRGKRVILVDIDLNTHNSHIYLSVDSPRWTIRELLNGDCSLDDALVEVPRSYWGGDDDYPDGSLHLLTGQKDDGTQLLELSDSDHRQLQKILTANSDNTDILAFDTGAGIDHHQYFCGEYCQDVLVITNAEATARVDAIKVLQFVSHLESPPSRWLVPNEVEDQIAGRRLFDHFQRVLKDEELHWAGAVRKDEALEKSALRGKMVLIEEPGSKASTDFRNVAKNILVRMDGESDGDFMNRIDSILDS